MLIRALPMSEASYFKLFNVIKEFSDIISDVQERQQHKIAQLYTFTLSSYAAIKQSNM